MTSEKLRIMKKSYETPLASNLVKNINFKKRFLTEVTNMSKQYRS